MSTLVITADALPVASAGRSLTMTVDGIGTPIQPGTYSGRIVLTPTTAIVVPSMLGDAQYRFRAGLYVDGGRPVPDKSVTAALGGGVTTDTVARDIKLISRDPAFNGIIVTGASVYTVDNATIHLSENGGDDSVGYGAAILANGDAKLTVNNARIVTRGVIRTAILADGNATVTVNDSDIQTMDGVLPPGYVPSILPGKMMEVPYGLGISGNVRATNVEGKATAIYNRTHIHAQAWGALATDGDGPTRLIARDSLIEVAESGYGAYANGEAHDLFEHCVFNVPDYGLVVGGPGSATFTKGTVVNSRRFGVMMHQGTGGGTVTIEDHSVFNTGSTAIEVKGRGTHIVIDAADLRPGNGVLLQTMPNDDPIMKEMMSGAGGPPPGAAPPADAPPRPTYSGDVVVEIRKTKLVGDVIHAMRDTGALVVTLVDAELEGAITTGTASPTSGIAPTQASFRTIGDVSNVFGATPETLPLHVSLERNATWVVGKTSYLTGLSIGQAARLLAPKGMRVVLSVGGKETPIKSGRYEGDIVVAVAPARM
ncbi:right-handed parallel beta-helix repeat-containing protein [Nitrospirillum iridis]|uniref:Right handed beta helix domain-containing protein n=1 Tax=Nitrospirillum iridis TaxID=765888 RepID=A0A7X0AZZ3_9PROT|nr:right-handed parallel beta-helix repeat-containing protein [Nitrospirillum iridis]MBB6253263.1 hypothetical protein [Nitrospirillum iridis]